MYFNYRFRLSDNVSHSDLESIQTKIEQILHSAQYLKLVRVAVDLTSPEKASVCYRSLKIRVLYKQS